MCFLNVLIYVFITNLLEIFRKYRAKNSFGLFALIFYANAKELATHTQYSPPEAL